MLLFVSGCSTNTPQQNPLNSDVSIPTNQIFNLLSKQYDDWKGTPYRLGGTNKNGIDCSALVRHIYQNSFNIGVARTTELQAKSGNFIASNNLKIGDLVFFKTSLKVRHVGIYMGSHQFMHASTSQGVIISTLSNSYWQTNYWQARRIFD